MELEYPGSLNRPWDLDSFGYWCGKMPGACADVISVTAGSHKWSLRVNGWCVQERGWPSASSHTQLPEPLSADPSGSQCGLSGPRGLHTARLQHLGRICLGSSWGIFFACVAFIPRVYSNIASETVVGGYSSFINIFLYQFIWWLFDRRRLVSLNYSVASSVTGSCVCVLVKYRWDSFCSAVCAFR